MPVALTTVAGTFVPVFLCPYPALWCPLPPAPPQEECLGWALAEPGRPCLHFLAGGVPESEPLRPPAAPLFPLGLGPVGMSCAHCHWCHGPLRKPCLPGGGGRTHEDVLHPQGQAPCPFQHTGNECSSERSTQPHCGPSGNSSPLRRAHHLCAQVSPLRLAGNAWPAQPTCR